MSPPWGGPDYSSVSEYRLRTMIPSGDGVELIIKAARLCRNIVYIIPFNTKLEDIVEASRLSGLDVCIEDVYICRKIKLRVAYFGAIFKSHFTNSSNSSSSNSSKNNSSNSSNKKLPSLSVGKIEKSETSEEGTRGQRKGKRNRKKRKRKAS